MTTPPEDQLDELIASFYIINSKDPDYVKQNIMEARNNLKTAILNLYIAKAEVVAALDYGTFVDPSKSKGELLDQLRKEIKGKLGLW